MNAQTETPEPIQTWPSLEAFSARPVRETPADAFRAFQTAVHALDMLPTTVELTHCGIKVATGCPKR